MSIFNAQSKIIDIVEHDSNLLPVLNRFEMKLGFGDITVNQACTSHKIDEDFFLGILNVYHNDNYFPEQKFVHFKISEIINYLSKTHQYYKSYVLPEIERLFNVLLCNSKAHRDIFLLLEKIFFSFTKEFKEHIDYEENTIFPKIIELFNKACANDAVAVKMPVLNFVSIHSQLDDKIIDIKNILIKYLPPIDDVNNCNAFAIAIFRFEKDLKDHARIEDRILYPKVKLFLNQTTDNDAE